MNPFFVPKKERRNTHQNTTQTVPLDQPVIHKYYLELKQYPNGIIVFNKMSPIGQTKSHFKKKKAVVKEADALADVQTQHVEEY